MTTYKAPFVAAFFLLLSLPACSLSWVTDPIAHYLKKKTGIEMKAEKVSAGVNPLHLETKGFHLNFKKGPASWEVKIQDLRMVLGWTSSWENLPWPKFHIEKVYINRPSVTIRLPEPGKGMNWTDWLKEIPSIKKIEVNDLKGRLEIGNYDFQLAPGAQVLASFSPDQGGKIEYQIKGLQGRFPSKEIKFQAKSKGAVELSDLQDKPKWKGILTLSHGNLFYKESKVSEVSGDFRFLYQTPLLEISASSAKLQEIHWLKNNLSFKGRGNIILSGSIRKEIDKKEGLFHDVNLKFDELDFDLKQKDCWIKGQAEGQAQLSGSFSMPVLKAKLSTRQTDLDLPPVKTQGMETEIHVEGKGSSLSFPLIWAKASQTNWYLASDPLSIINPETRFSAHFTQDSRKIHLKDIWLKTDNWGTLSGNLIFDPSKGPAPSGQALAEGFPLPRFLKHFFPKADEPFSEDIPCQGTIEWSREAADSPVVFQVSISPAPFSFQIPAIDWEGGGLKAQIDAQGKWFSRINKIELVLNHHLSGGSISQPPWIFSFNQNPLTARFEGTVEGAGQAGFLKGFLGLRYDPLGEVTVSGEWPFGSSPRSYSGSIEVQNFSLEKGFPLLIGDPLSDNYPFWRKASLRGFLNARFFISKRNEAYEFKGRLTGSGIDLKTDASSFSFYGLNLDLPFHLSSSGIDPGKILFSESGFIRVENVRGPQVSVNRLHLSILAKTNQFEVLDKIQVPFWGGRLSLNSFKLTNPLKDFKINTVISLKDLELIQMFKGADITGVLNGDLGPIRIDKEKAQIEGTLKADVFEGTVEGKNWIILHPFSLGRKIQGDLFFNHLNLESITQRFSFGKITGFVQGQVTGLSLRDHQPEKFYLWVRTQEVPGVPKSIHIKAIENISLLGTGWGELDVLPQGINRGVNEYDYQEIGLACSLKQGLFSVHGTIIEEEAEYLVRRPSWFGIDIINKNPDNEIQFSDMIDRIRRIGNKLKEGNRDEKN